MKMTELRGLREKIDNIDESILDLLALRDSFARQIAKIKKKKASKIIDLKREQEVIGRVIKKSEELRLDKKYALGIFRMILKNSRRIQK